MKIIGIGGEPATGKTTLVRAFMATYPAASWHHFKVGLVEGHLNREFRLGVFGTYHGNVFDGTDRLSMAVQPRMKMFLTSAAKTPELRDYTFFFEGDRLFGTDFIQFTKTLTSDTVYLILTASDRAKAQRHLERRDGQPETFLKAKATKIRNIYSDVHGIIKAPHETLDDTEAMVKYLRGLCAGSKGTGK